MREVKVMDLRNEKLIGLPVEEAVEIEFNRRLAEKKMASPETIETIHSSTICTFAARGLGMGIINPYMASVFKD